MPFVTTKDSVKLHYVSHGGGSGSPIVLVHGWSGSHRYFDNSIELLAGKSNSRIIAYDLRFHGDSDKPSHGFHVARLAADLHELIVELKLEQPIVVGTSLGCAIIWSYVELYTDASLGGCVFVDQAPSQWTFPDWKHGSKGIYDPASLLNIQNVVRDLPAFAKGNAECCLTKPVDAALMTVLTEETLKCDPEHLGKLMADHACALPVPQAESASSVPRAADLA